MPAWIMIFVYSVMVGACAGPNRQNDVWSNYDYLTPVPQSSGVQVQPSNREIPYYRQVQDNDDTYVIPYQFGICNDGATMFGCE